MGWRVARLAVPATLLCFALSAKAEGLRCGDRLITRGDPAVKLLRYCGKPESVSSRIEPRAVFRFGRFLPGFVNDVVVEDWIYNFGPYKLMRNVRIVDGVVKDIELLGYGYTAP